MLEYALVHDDPVAATILHNVGGLHYAHRDLAVAEPYARRAVELGLRSQRCPRGRR